MGSVVSPIRAAEAGRAVAASTVDVSAFREAMGSFPTGVTVVTVACDDGNLHGMTVNSFSSVSLDPMLVLVCLDETSRGLGLIERAGAFVVNVLSAGQQDVSRWFANRHRPAVLAVRRTAHGRPGGSSRSGVSVHSRWPSRPDTGIRASRVHRR
jgi:flavin reductase (DIM6/NTAB) family NADH-FMN oxidoreductase RutF